MSLADEIADGLREREADVVNTFTWSAASYACSASSYSTTKRLDVGGFEVETDLSITARLSLFPGAKPQEQQTLTHRSRTYRIEKVVYDATGTFIRILCVSNNRGV